MASLTYSARATLDGQQVVISFYKEQPGGWKLNFEDKAGRYAANGDLWVETLDDLVLQIAHRTGSELEWQESESGEPVSFYVAVKRCVT